MLSPVYLVLVFCSLSLAETVLSHEITKREAEETSELQLENDLRRVKRIMKDDDLQTLARVKRMKRRDSFENELNRLKRVKRSLYGVNIPQAKRMKRSSIVLPELTRVKRFKQLELDTPALLRVKRLRRAVLRHPNSDNYLSRVKRTKRSSDFGLSELSRIKRFREQRIPELSRVKRLKRQVSHLLPSRKSKRIPPDLRKDKKFRNEQKVQHMLQSDRYINNQKRHFHMKKSQRKRFRALHGKNLHMDGKMNIDAVKRELSRQSGAIEKKRGIDKDAKTFKQRVKKRLHQKHKLRKNRLNHKKEKKDKHHVQSHRINKKNTS